MTKRIYQKSVAGRRVTLNIPEADLAKAALIGGGNYSKGVRLAVNAYYERMLAGKGLNPDNVSDSEGDRDSDNGRTLEDAPALACDPEPNPKPCPESGPPAQPRTFGRVVTEIQPIDDDDDGTISAEEWAEFHAEQARSIAKASRMDAVRANAAQPGN